ncbi:ankyrin [Laetiporus sulphureus 93-53]|uniref:Ankyrin n=1 Tax=Laetiporus sulphureus 93-53 TaxID=1314785 RepID=A0A165ERP3_9APHY|nr:ankyrin [Laetiporus sulphureus 93-53]KZT07626.1 ankyrin [Laetiporus sulphureus 93-53]
MPVSTRVQAEKNVWVAAGDGDLERVRELIENQCKVMVHAAASYGHLHVLEYLISKGGDVNITDNDGDTPLYVVEDVETARYLVEHGAIVDRRNSEGLSPAEYLAEDYEEVAAYLESVSPARRDNAVETPPVSATASQQPSQYAQNIASEQLTSSLMESVQDIMQRASAEGRDPEEELRQAVGRTVLEGMVTGYGMSIEAEDSRREDSNGTETKRSRMDDDGPG